MKSRFSIAILLVVALSVLTTLPAFAEAPAAVQWLQQQQRADGGFGMEKSTLSETAETIYALAAAGEDVSAVATEGKSPLDFLAEHVTEATTVGAQAKVAMAAAVAGANPYALGGSDLIANIKNSLNSEGMYGGAEDTLIGHAYAMLALASVGEAIPQEAVAWLSSHQAENGGWAWNGSDKPEDADTNTSALAVQALIAAGVSGDDSAIGQALEYLRSVQNDDGGFPYQKPSPYGTDTDANSTAVVIQALIAAGEDPATWASTEGKTPLDALTALQNDSGAFAWQAAFPDDNLLATAQAVPALMGKAHPIAVARIAASEVLPTTGAAMPIPASALMLAGSALIAGGYLLRRKVAA